MNRRQVITTGLIGGALFAAFGGQHAAAQDVSGTPSAIDEANPFVFGSGLDLIPAGNPDTVEVVVHGAVVSSHVPLVVRNTTEQTVTLTEIIGTLRDGSGKLLDTVGFAEFAPVNLLPNGVALGIAHFSEESIPLDAQVELVVEYEAGPSGDKVELPVTELEANSDGFVGAVTNTTDFPVDFVQVVGVTLADDGTPIGFFDGYVENDILAPNDTGYFDGWLRGQPSLNYLVAAVGR